MRYYKVNKVEHCIYEPGDALPDNMTVVEDWREGKLGDWIRTDDDCVLQILYEGKMKKTYGKVCTFKYIRTCTGTYIVRKGSTLTSEKKKNIYALGGKSIERLLEERVHPSKEEAVFALFLSQGMHRLDAYLKAFRTNNRGYALKRANLLVGTERIKKAVKKELEPVLKELGIDEEYVLSNIKGVADASDSDKVKLSALFKLSDILDLEDKSATKVQQYTGLQFTGFSQGELEKAERKEIEGREVSQE